MDAVVLASSGGTIHTMAEPYVTFRTDAKGRTVIPAALRAQAGIREDGDVLVGHVEGERLIIETRATIKRRLHAQASATGATGMVDRLLADRRADMDLEEPAQPAADA
jgi:bifunctional DNA-binding transcriptional regulator/antitoxin component of YhaV-PrlF toxin-antitoxin module